MKLVAIETVEDKERGLFGRVQLELVVAARVLVASTARPEHSIFDYFGVLGDVPAFGVNLSVHGYTGYPLLLHEFEALLEVNTGALIVVSQLRIGQFPSFFGVC